MPVVLLLDVSLSMLRKVDDLNLTVKEISRKKMAVDGLIYLLEKFAILKLEFVSLIYFAEDAEIVADFTKDYASISEILKNKCDLRTKTDYMKALHTVLNHCSSTWGGNTKCFCLILTDSSDFPDRNSLGTDESFVEISRKSNVSLEFCFLNQNHQSVGNEFFSDLIKKNSGGGHLHYLNTNDSKSKPENCLKIVLDFIYESRLAPMKTRLKCGSLISEVCVFPRIISSISDDQLSVVGFLKPADLANPPIYSKHLILAAYCKNRDSSESNRGKIEEERQPNLCVLLHGSIKIEDTVALCHLGADRYGYIYCLADSKRSNLVLYCLKSGTDSVQWLGNLDQFVRKFDSNAPAKLMFQSKFKPSYATTNPSWVQNYGLQSDLQKIIRYAKKLPDKETVFYLELNRIVNHAMSLGCVDLLLNFLEKEKSNTVSNTPQAKHLNYVTKMLSSPKLKYGEPILPMMK